MREFSNVQVISKPFLPGAMLTEATSTSRKML